MAQYVRGPIPGSIGQPPSRIYRTDSPSLSAREAENFTPAGIRLGTFKLFAELELDELYNDNLYATPAYVGTTGAFIQQVRPNVALKSDWNRHMLNAFATSNIGFSSVDASLNNYQDVTVGIDGRLDIQRRQNVYGAATWNRLHEAPGTPSAVAQTAGAQNGTPLTTYNLLSVSAGGYQKFNRFSVRADGRLDNYVYEPNSLGFSQGVIPNTDRNRNEWQQSLRLGYEFFPGYEAWVRGRLNQRTYLQLDANGLDRSSSGFDVVGGISVDLGGLTSIEAFVGFLRQNYVDTQFQPISTPTFGVTGYWNPYPVLWIRPFVQRTIDDSALTTSSAYINTVGGVEATYQYRPDIIAEASLGYNSADYLPQSGASASRFDQYAFVRASLMYSPTRRLFVGPQYQYLHRWSNQAGNDFSQNIFMLRLGTHF